MMMGHDVDRLNHDIGVGLDELLKNFPNFESL